MAHMLKNLDLTLHAEKRVQPRCIPQLILDWLDAYGASEKCLSTGQMFFFDKRAIKDLKREIGAQAVSHLRRYLRVYMAVNDGRVITVGYRTRHILRS